MTAVIGESAVQLQAFAAPRTEGVWVDIRNEIAASIVDAGGTAEVLTGEFGEELLTRMPQADHDGRTVFMPARFVGIDGPRWFLRAVVSGRAAIEPAAADAVHEVIRTAVIDRGDEAMPPRELLPLRLPEAEGAAQADGADTLAPRRAPTSTRSSAAPRSPRSADGRPVPGPVPAPSRRVAAVSTGQPSALRRLTERWTRSAHELEAAELRHESSVLDGVVHIGDAPQRTTVTVAGDVRSVTLRPREETPDSMSRSGTAPSRSTSCGWADGASPASSRASRSGPPAASPTAGRSRRCSTPPTSSSAGQDRRMADGDAAMSGAEDRAEEPRRGPRGGGRRRRPLRGRPAPLRHRRGARCATSCPRPSGDGAALSSRLCRPWPSPSRGPAPRTSARHWSSPGRASRSCSSRASCSVQDPASSRMPLPEWASPPSSRSGRVGQRTPSCRGCCRTRACSSSCS